MIYSGDPLREYLTWRRYAYRFFPSWGSALLLSLNNIAINMTLSLWHYAKVNHLPTEFAFGTGMALCLIFYAGQIMLFEGFRHAFRILIPVALVNTWLAIGYLANHPATLFNLLPVFTSLLYILVLNSKNHRRYICMLRIKRRRKIRFKALFT